jgi:hypothetical protein
MPTHGNDHREVTAKMIPYFSYMSINYYILVPTGPHYIFFRKTYVKESYNSLYLEETYRLEHFCYAIMLLVARWVYLEHYTMSMLQKDE